MGFSASCLPHKSVGALDIQGPTAAWVTDANRVWKQRTAACIASSPIHKCVTWEATSFSLLWSRNHTWEEQMRECSWTFLLQPQLCWTGAVSVCPRGHPAKSQLVPRSGDWRPRVWLVPGHPITHKWGPKTHPEKGAQERQLGFSNEDFKAAPPSTCPCARSGPGDRDSLGQEVRPWVTYSSDAMTTRPCSYDSNHIVKFRGNSNKGKTILKTVRFGV